LPEGTTGASISGTTDSVNDGAHAAKNVDPAITPAAFINSRLERYCEYDVISDDFTGTDLYLLFMSSPIIWNSQLASIIRQQADYSIFLFLSQQCLDIFFGFFVSASPMWT
jgi:hypothetical protein